ncbi:hypothetical protein J437_LFUL003606 [Ladona fulva]|uniref:Threonine aspartase 1 n=1 Tax=Ladona fulva TaxID=123851 RepID=A0A8K0P7W9_LADFU|nr:hypothetical protein J437_LFUL003606 [Ladona fulva]
MPEMAGFIGVHLGAGNYSESEERNYKKLCRSACRKGSATLLSGGSALDAAVAATMILESSALTNAGFGSNLNIDGNVEAPIFGAGCWAEDARKMGNKYIMDSIAVSTTGCGEYLVRTSLARELASSCHLSDGSATVPLHTAFTEKYLKRAKRKFQHNKHSQFLEDVEVSGRLGGAIVLRAIGPTDYLEFLWAHSTKSMCIGYMLANSESKPKSHISQLPKGSMIGSKVTVEGISLEISPKDC